MFFAVTHGKNAESALSLMNLLNMLPVKSVHQLQALKFAFRWHKKGVAKRFSELFPVCRSSAQLKYMICPPKRTFISDAQEQRLENNQSNP